MKLVVTNVDKRPQPSGVVWIVRYEVVRGEGDAALDSRISPEHSVFVHAFPEERILAAIAEFSLDANDMDSVMDIILAEPFIDADDGEPTLFSGAERSVICEAHRRRCARAKLRTRMATRGIRNPIEMIRQIRIDGTKLTETKARVMESLQKFGENRG